MGECNHGLCGCLPRKLHGFNSIWVIVDRLTKFAHFLPVKTTYNRTKYAELYIKEIIRLHGILISIMSDRDPRFTFALWKSFHTALGTKLAFSTAFHPQTDGQFEKVIQILEDLLRACVIDFPESWDTKLPLVEFTYNNNYKASIDMAPYQALYGRNVERPFIGTRWANELSWAPILLDRQQRLLPRFETR